VDVDTDFQASKRPKVTAALKQYFESIGGEVYNIATFGTETAKAALQTAARGLGYDSDLGLYVSSLVPIDRGKVRTLQQCYYGDEEKDFAPIPQFVTTMNQYQDIWEVAQKVEGTICRRGLHACGMLIVNEDFCEHNAIMKAPNGTLCSQFELHDSEFMGGVKFDALTTDALDRIRTCLDLLLKYGYIEWEENLKETYNKYIGLENLDYETEKMWNEIGENKISNLFQYDTPVGLATAKQVKPKSTMELAIANSLMRLMADESGIMPSETFTRYKNNIDLWYAEMHKYGLSDEEIKIMEKHLLANSGVCESQEGIMMISMDEHISNFSVKEANKLRKTIAKKKLAEIDNMHEMFMQKGREAGASDNLLNYVWNVQVKRQLGYSFSVLHSFGYSLIAVQEMNLAYHYPTIFWNCANLIVDSAGIDENDEFINLIDDFDPATENTEETEEENDDDEEMTKEEKEEIKKQNKTVNYGKIASAIGKMMALGINVELPDINKSEFTFTPDLDTNSIIFGIKGINRINNDLAKAIIDNRPFNSLQDFLNRVKTNKVSAINLIKSGCFDRLEKRPREEIMKDYIDQISDKKQKLTLQNMAMLIRENCIPEEYKTEVHIYNFNKYLKNFKKDIYYMLDERAFNFYEKMFDMDLVSQDEQGNFRIRQNEWDKIYKKQMTGIKEELKANPTILNNLNQKLFDAMWNKYAEGTISKWEMDSVCFYYHAHELVNIDRDRYLIENYTDLAEEPVIEKIWTTKDGKEIPIFKLTRICGTVIDKNKTKNIVTLLTNDGVVNLKIYRAQFSKYDKQISVKDEVTGKKTIIERSWFKRGNKLMVVGIRRGDNFVPKIYKNNPYFTYPIELITNIDEDGKVKVAGDRAG
jgi:DNA polymerase-3 subunit alpha